MKAEQFLVKVSINGRDRSELWDPAQPLRLGSPMRWVLENGPTGVMIRDLGHKVGEVVEDAAIPVPREALDSGKLISVPGARGGKAALLVQVQRLKPIPPAFSHTTDAAHGAQLSQLFAFAGVLRSVIGAQAMHSAYVAYAKGRPTFTVYRNAEGYKVKPLLNGVHLKFKGEEPTSRPAGESWQLSEEELLNATVTRGRYWWRFNLVNVPARVQVDHVVPELEEKRFRLALRSMGLLLLLLLMMSWFIPAEQKVQPEQPPAPTVKFARPKPKQNNEFVAEMKPMKLQPAKVIQHEKKPTPAAEAVAPPPKPLESAPKVAKENVDIAAGAPSPKIAPAAKAPKTGSRTKSPVVAKVPTAPTIPPEVLREKQAEQAAAKRAKALRDALGGAIALVQNKDIEKNSANLSAISVDKPGSKGAAFAPTDVKAGDIKTQVQVGTIGGRNSGKEGGVGYAVGEHAKLKGQGGSFVSMQTNDVTVDEGLTKEEVGAVIHAHMGEVRYCHEASMLANPKVEGKLVLQFGINPKGVVESVSVQSTTLPERKITDCVTNRLRTWQFPRPKGGIHVSVSYPFLFKTLGKE
jgi:outer membrane biosynthesis protein TonB